LVAVTKHGRRALPKIPSPFVATHLNKHPPLREGTATLFPGDAFVPRIVAGDFDHDSRGEAVVFSERVMSLEYAEDSDGSLWPNPFSVGQVYRASGDRIEVHPGFAAIQVAEVRGGARDAVLFSFGGLFRMVSPGPLGASEGDYPAFGPLFRVFVRKDHRATEDDPRQVEHLAAQCAQVRKTQCASMNLDVAVRFRVVCAEPAVVRLVSGTTCDRVESLAERALSGAWRADIGEALRWWTARESSK
jgi:hypothetical protein